MRPGPKPSLSYYRQLSTPPRRLIARPTWLPECHPMKCWPRDQDNKRQNMNPVISFLVELKKIIQPTARKLRLSQESFDKLSNFDILLTQSLTDKINVLASLQRMIGWKIEKKPTKLYKTKHERWWWWSKQSDGIQVEKFSLFSLAITVYSYCCLLSLLLSM